MPIDPTPDVLPDPQNEVDHAAGIYDPSQHDDQLVAVFDTRADAQAALDKLTQAGIAGDAAVVDGSNAQPQETGFVAALKSLFAPDDEMTHYTEGLRRGHALLVTHPTPETRLPIVQTVAACNPIDFDAKLEEWRAAGWKNLARQEATTMGAEADAGPGEGAPSGSAGVAATDTDVRNRIESHLQVSGQRDPARDSGPIRSYIAPRR